MAKFVRYSEDVLSLEQAWVFVMEHVDEFDRPNIKIRPAFHGDHPTETTMLFGAMVYGYVKEDS